MELVVPVACIPSEIIPLCKVMPLSLIPKLLYVEGHSLQVVLEHILHLISSFILQVLERKDIFQHTFAPVIFGDELD